MRRGIVACFFLAALLARATEEPPAKPAEHLPLPDAPPANRELKLGDKLALDDLGPLIVTPDGSLRRIANWQALSEAERATALRRLAKRNRERLATLEEQQHAQQQLSDRQQQQGGGQQPDREL